MLSAGKETLLVKAVNHSSLNKLVTTSYKPNWMSSTHELSFNTVRVDIHLKQLPITNINYKHQSFPQVLVNCTFWKASNDTVQWHLLQFVYSNPDGGKHQENHCLWLLQCAQPKILYTYKLSLLFLRIYQDYECSNTGLISILGSKLPAAL